MLRIPWGIRHRRYFNARLKPHDRGCLRARTLISPPVWQGRHEESHTPEISVQGTQVALALRGRFADKTPVRLLLRDGPI